jgi:predicted nucleic acid-binding protein
MNEPGFSKPGFLDTNVLVYALDDANPHKQKIAKALVAEAVQPGFAISAQVLAELASTLIHKYSSTYSFQDVLAILDSLRPIRLIRPDIEIVRRAVEARAEYGIHFYDGMIIAAAERAGAKEIFSEDLNAGQKYFGIEVVDPFR